MAASAIERWDRVLDELEKTRKESPFINLLVPGYKRFEQGFHLTVDTITKAFRDAWQTDRPAEGSAFYAVLELIAAAVDEWDFEQPAEPQVDKFMGVVAEARRTLAEDDLGGTTAEEIVAGLETLLEVSVLVARVGHRGAMEIADKERQGRYQSVNRAKERPATYLDLNNMRWVDRPSKTTLALSVFLTIGKGCVEAAEHEGDAELARKRLAGDNRWQLSRAEVTRSSTSVVVPNRQRRTISWCFGRSQVHRRHVKHLSPLYI